MGMFNDTFTIFSGGHQLAVSSRGIAWKADLDRLRNPEDYGTRANTSWLHDRYPGIISQPDGVHDERFAVWMRPSALPNIRKKYGILRANLRTGQIITVRLGLNFLADSPHLEKRIGFTTLTNWGGTDNSLAVILLA